MNLKDQGMDLFCSNKYEEAARFLQVAEMFLRPPYPVQLQSVKRYWCECWKYEIAATWECKIYGKAIQVGKKWRQMEPITSQVCEDSLIAFAVLHLLSLTGYMNLTSCLLGITDQKHP